MHLCSLTFGQLRQFFQAQNCESWRASQVWHGLYARRESPEFKIHNLGSASERALATLTYPCLALVEKQLSGDGQTIKFLWRLPDQQLVESVLIKAPDRLTICVSSQVGCPARCAFCASGQGGFVRNLTTAEIVEQVLHIQIELYRQRLKVSNLVFMGMGEPLCNCDAVLAAIEIFGDERGLNFSQRKISISTVGIPEGLQRLLQSPIRVNLVLSLHAPNQRLRQKIVPFARKYPLQELLALCDTYFAKTQREVSYEYILIRDLNDQVHHALELANLMGQRRGHVNLIPYNPVAGISLQRPDSRAIERFRSTLLAEGIATTRRYTKGDDIAAACGQLALRKRQIPAPLGSRLSPI